MHIAYINISTCEIDTITLRSITKSSAKNFGMYKLQDTKECEQFDGDYWKYLWKVHPENILMKCFCARNSQSYFCQSNANRNVSETHNNSQTMRIIYTNSKYKSTQWKSMKAFFLYKFRKKKLAISHKTHLYRMNEW